MGFWRDRGRVTKALDRAGVRYALRIDGSHIGIDLHPVADNLARAYAALDAIDIDREKLTITEALGPATEAERVEEAALMAAIMAAPDDDAPRLVYADRLMARGDPLGELIVMQCKRDPALHDAITRKLERGWRGLAGDVAPFVWSGRPGFPRGFDRGFVEEAYMTVDDVVAHGARVFGLYPTQWLVLTDHYPDLARLGAAEALAFVPRLRMSPLWDTELAPLAGAHFDRLVELDFGLVNARRDDRSADHQALFSRLRAPRLATIDLRYSKTSAFAGAIADNPHLTSVRCFRESALNYEPGVVKPEAYAALTRRFALQELALRHSSPSVGDDGLLPLFAPDTPAAVRVLVLEKTGITDRFLFEAARSPKVKLLERVQLVEEALTIAGLRAFLDAATGLRELAVVSTDPEIEALVRSRRTSGG